MNTQDLKTLVDRYSLAQILACIQQQLETGNNRCMIADTADEIVTALSKAEVVRELMDQGLDFHQALRELGHRIRKIYGKEDE